MKAPIGRRSVSGRRLRVGRALVLAAWCFPALPAAGAEATVAAPPSEIEVKAAFLYHFAQLVTWPEEATSDPSQPVVVAVVGTDPFGERLENTIGSETVRGRPLRLVRAAQVGDLDEAPHILFVGSSDRAVVARMLASVARKPVLTVGAMAGFARQGGMIEFRVTPDSRVAFDINRRAAEAAGLRISSQLLKLARIVEAP